MGFKNLLSIFLVIVIIHVASLYAKKAHGSAPKSTGTENSDIPVTKELGKTVETSFSSEMQQLRELASKESGSIILKPTHARRKNKHHRRRRPHGGGRSHKKNKTSTRPLDILKAEDNTKVKHSETTAHIDHEAKSHKRTRTRGSRHLDLESRTTRGPHHHHRRPRIHHHSKNGQIHHSRNNANSLIADHGLVDKHGVA